MKHKFHACNEHDCFICVGGLGLCVICNGAEASLPTDCPGKPIHHERQDDIQAGLIDFKDGKWVVLKPHELSRGAVQMTITYLISKCERIGKPERICFQVAELHLIGTAIRNAKWFYSTTLGMDGIE